MIGSSREGTELDRTYFKQFLKMIVTNKNIKVPPLEVPKTIVYYLFLPCGRPRDESSLFEECLVTQAPEANVYHARKTIT